jgi:hypothetical protein
MSDKSRLTVSEDDAGGNSVESTEGTHDLNSPRTDESVAAKAAVLAAIALPLMKVRDARAESTTCWTADSTITIDIGEPTDCVDCAVAAIPVDCGGIADVYGGDPYSGEGNGGDLPIPTDYGS